MFIPKPTEGGTYDPAPAGTHIGICYRLIDRGTQMKEYNGEKKTRHEVMLTWELSDEEMQDGRPFSISKVFTLSMHEKASLRRDLEAWRGRSFTDDDFEGPNRFNMKKLIGAPCMLTVMHKEKEGRTYAEITGIGKLLKNIQPPPLRNDKSYLALDEEGWSAEVYGGLSEKMKEIISSSPEYKSLMQALSKPGDEPHDDGAGRFDDDIPF